MHSVEVVFKSHAGINFFFYKQSNVITPKRNMFSWRFVFLLLWIIYCFVVVDVVLVFVVVFYITRTGEQRCFVLYVMLL